MRRWRAIGLAVGLAASAEAATAEAAAPGPDAVRKAWDARAARAAKKLAKPGLDACERALETAFQRFKEEQLGSSRSFVLEIDIGEKVPTLLSYSYSGDTLREFVVMLLPPGNIVHQPSDSKTVSVVFGKLHCSIDLCANNPFSEGPCPRGAK